MNDSSRHKYDLFVSYSEADRAWVRGYLLDALAQADVRYHSEAAFELGRPRLTEFERAVEQSRRTLLVISPAYLADELDQFVNLLAQSYGLETASWPVIPLMLKPVKLPPRLAGLTALDATDPDDWPHVIGRLCTALEVPVPEPAPKPPCPYPGMIPYSEADSQRFFGRDHEIAELLERLRLHSFLTLIGPSGSGKSSLVFAGLIQALRHSGLFGSGEWLVQSMRPGETPLETLKNTLGGGDADDVVQMATALLSSHPEADHLLLIVDQFEEIFTIASGDTISFQECLLQLRETPGCYVLLTVRADFYPDLMASPLWGDIRNHRMEILPLDEEGLRQAIVKPAETVGVYVEAALVERLIADSIGEPGILPLVQETLVLLWEHLDRRCLTLNAYESLILSRRSYGPPYGGIESTGLQVALARRADAALAELDSEQRAIARRVFLRLVQFGEGRADTRRQQAIDALSSADVDPQMVEQTLYHLADRRLVTLSGEEREAVRSVDLAHETLIISWPSFQRWLGERREAEQTRRRLEMKAAEWARLGRGSGGLLDEVELHEAEQWMASPDADDLGYSEELTDLIQVSRRAIEEAKRQERSEQQRRLRRARVIIAGLALLLTVTVATILFAYDQRRILDARRLAFAAQSMLDESPETAMLLAYEAVSRHHDFRTEQALRDVVEQFTWKSLILGGHEGPLTSANFSSDGRSVLTSSVDGTARLWDADTGESLVRFQGNGEPMTTATFSPDEQRVLTASEEGLVQVWDVGTGQLLSTLEGHEDEVVSLEFSPDGERILSASADATARLWEAATGEGLFIFEGHEDEVVSAEFSPDGQRVLTASADATARLWEAETGEALFTFEGHDDLIVSAVFSPDGKLALTASEDGTVRFWNVTTGEQESPALESSGEVLKAIVSPDGAYVLSAATRDDHAARLWISSARQLQAVFYGHTRDVTRLAFSPDGQRVLTAARDQTARLWDLDGQLLTSFYGHTDAVIAIAFGPDGQRVLTASSDGTARVWNEVGPPLPSFVHDDEVESAFLSSDGRQVLTASRDQTARLWDAHTGQPIVTFRGHTDVVNTAVFSPNEQRVVTAGESDDATARLWDARTGKELAILVHDDEVGSAVFGPDGVRILTASDDWTAALWDAITGQLIISLEGHEDEVEEAVFSPDGRLVLTAAEDSTARLWDANTGRQVVVFDGHEDDLKSAVFSPDGRLVLTAAEDSTARLWDLDGQELAVMRHNKGLERALFSPDGGRILTASADHTAKLWDVSGAERATFSGHTDVIKWASFSKDGRRILTASDDFTARLWGLSGEPLAIFYGHENWVASAVFDPNDQRVLTASKDHTARQFLVNVNDLLAVAACRVPRGLTADELERFGVEQPRFVFEARQCPPDFSWD